MLGDEKVSGNPEFQIGVIPQCKEQDEKLKRLQDLNPGSPIYREGILDHWTMKLL